MRDTLVQSLHQLPPPPPNFTGRDTDLDELKRKLTSLEAGGVTISSVRAGLQGMGGVGKTALAVVLAHRLKDRYPDAQLFLNLRGADPDRRPSVKPAEAMQNIIQSFRPEARLPDTLDELAPIYRSVLAGAGHVLLLLDNAADAAQVSPLLPPPNCLLLVTSRQQFQIPSLETRSIDCLDPGNSRELLLKLAPRINGHANEAAELCGYLPLALEVFAGAVNARRLYSVPELLERLCAGKDKLAPVEATFQVSFDLLSAEMRQRWTVLAVFPASFDLSAAAAVWEEKKDAARDSMQTLVNASLVEWNETSGRFHLHDLVRQFCDGRLSADDRDGVLFRYAKHFTNVAAAAGGLYLKGGDSVLHGLQLFDRERAHLEAAFEWLQSRVDLQSAALLDLLVDAVADTSEFRFHPRQHIRWLEARRTAARVTKNRQTEGSVLCNIGRVYAESGEASKAVKFHEQALMIAREIGDRKAEGIVLGNLGIAYAYLGESRRALRLFEQGLAIAQEIRYRRGEGNALGNLGNVYRDMGEMGRAVVFYEQSLRSHCETGNLHGESVSLGNLGVAYATLGDPRKAREFFERQLVIVRQIGDRRGEGHVLSNLANTYKSHDELRKAIKFYERALVISHEIGDRRGEANTLGNLGLVHAAMSDTRKAIEFYEQQLVITREIGDRRGEGNALFNSALTLDTLGNRAPAIDRAEAALKIFESIQDPNASKVRAQLAEWRGGGSPAGSPST